jgi:glycerol kinase
MKKYILALDQGTTSSRALLFDRNMSIVASEQYDTVSLYPNRGWVEQDAELIWHNQLGAAQSVITQSGIDIAEIAGIGITNQRETTVVWDRHTGKPIYNAIIWQDKRTSALCGSLKQQGAQQKVGDVTGLVLDPYFSASKISWILENVPGAAQMAANGDLLFGTIDTWLVWNLTGGKLHITDASNASRTLLYNIVTGAWDDGMLEMFGVPEDMLPRVLNSSEMYGVTGAAIFGGKEIPIAGIAGDQQAALFGQACFESGMAKNTYGTGCFMLMNTGNKRIRSESGLLTTVAWRINDTVEYALEGSVFIAGAAIQWLRDNLKVIGSAAETETLAREAGDNGGVYFVPAFAGLGAPHWDMHARGLITGLTQATDHRHLARAVLEAMAYQTKDVLCAMERDSGISLRELNVDGGASVNNFLMQFQSDILGTPVVRPANVETTAAGAAFLAGLATGFWTKDELASKRRADRVFHPMMSAEKRDGLYADWLKAVERACSR